MVQNYDYEQHIPSNKDCALWLVNRMISVKVVEAPSNKSFLHSYIIALLLCVLRKKHLSYTLAYVLSSYETNTLVDLSWVLFLNSLLLIVCQQLFFVRFCCFKSSISMGARFWSSLVLRTVSLRSESN